MESEIVPTRVGQESHPAIRRPQFRAEAQPHLGQPVGRRGRNQKSAFTQCRDYNTVDKESAVTRQTEEAPTPFRHQGGHNCPHCGQLRVLKGRCSGYEIAALTVFLFSAACCVIAKKMNAMAKKWADGERNIRKRKGGCWEGRYTAGHDLEAGKRSTRTSWAGPRERQTRKRPLKKSRAWT